MSYFIPSAFALISLASMLYSVYSIFDGFFEPILGLVLAIVSLFVFLWCLSAYQRESISGIEIFSLFISVLVLCGANLAYSDIEPFATGKDQFLSELQTLGIPTFTNPTTNTTTNMERKSPIEIIKRMFASSPATLEGIEIVYSVDTPIPGTNFKGLIVSIAPTAIALANKEYKVDLIEKRKIRATTTVRWSQLEINAKKIKEVHFPLSDIEFDAYLDQDVSLIFKIDVHE